MPNVLDSTDPFTAALERARAGYRSKSRPQLLQPEKSDEHLAKTQDELNLDNPSAFESVLRTVGLGGSAVRNVLKGNVEGVYRNTADLLTSGLRAILPGDQSSWELSRKEDLPEFSDVIGGMEPGLAKTGVDLVGGILTDPLSFLGVGEFSAAAKAAKVANAAAKAARGTAGAAEALQAAKVADEALKAARAAGQSKKALGVGLPFMHPAFEIPGSADALAAVGSKVRAAIPQGVADAAKDVGFGLRKTFAALKPSAKAAEDVAAGEALGGATRLAAQTSPVAAFAGIPEDIQRRAIETLRGVTSERGQGVADLGIESAKELLSKPEQMALVEQRIAAMPWDDATKQAVRDTTEKIVDYTRGQFAQGVKDQVFSAPEGLTSSLATKALEQAPADYFPGRYTLPEAAAPEAARPGLPNLIKGASIRTSKELAEHLNRTGGALDTNVSKVLGQYGESMGKAAQSAEVMRRTVGEGFRALADPKSRELFDAAVTGLRDAGDLDSAHVLETAARGLPPPGPIMRTLAKINQPFKAAATAGVLIPNLNFTIGNVVSNVVQAVQNPEARGVAMRSLMSLPRVIGGSIADGLKRIGISAFPESHFDQVVNAAKASGGTREGMLKLIKDPELKAAVEHGVLDGGFVSAEQLGTDFATKGNPKNWKNLAFWTQDIAKGSEQRMRFGMFKDLMADGKSAKEAARIVDDTLFNYKYSSVANRNARQIIPFGQYTFKATPQVAKFLAEKPAAMAAIRPLYAQDDPNKNPLPPWTQGNINIPLGKGETGNPQYLTSLRLPFEQLANIPNPSADLGDFLAQTRSDVVGQASPLIKTAIGAFGGNDPRTGQPFMSYDRAPAALEALGMDAHGEAARRYNALVATGAPVIAPIGSTIATLSKLLDQRQSVPVAALNSLTGLKVIDVDEQYALKQIVEDAIRRDPSIKSTASYYQLSKSPEGQALLDKLKDIRRQLKAKRADKPLLTGKIRLGQR